MSAATHPSRVNSASPPPDAPVRAALYARVSTKDQDCAVQLAALHDEAVARGWTFPAEYVDRGQSGAKTSRPALDALMRDVQAGRVNLVAVYAIDRLSRSLAHLVMTLDDWSARGADFVSLRERHIDTTNPQGRLMFVVVAAFAEYQRAIIRSTVQDGVDAAITEREKTGRTWGRPRRALDLAMADLLLSQGKSVRHVAKVCNIPRGTLQRRLADRQAAA